MAKKAEIVSKESVEQAPDPFVAKVENWLRDAREVKSVLDMGNAVSPGAVQRLMAQAIPIIERFSER